MKKYLFPALLILFVLNLNSGCKKGKGNPPLLPPAESMTIDFSNFVSGKKSVESITDLKGIENSNWEFVALVSGYWRSILTITLAVPVATFSLAVKNSPVYLDSKTWQWSYNAAITVNQVSVTYKARLTGQIRDTDVLWTMYISKEGAGAFTEFVWFEGTSKPDGTSGQWILNHSPQFPEEVLQIDWTKSGTSIGTIKYTYVRALNTNRITDPFKDSYIEYDLTNATLNAKYNIHYFNGLSFSDVNVEWNTTTHNGRVKSSAYFGNTNWYCWDSNLINTTCLP